MPFRFASVSPNLLKRVKGRSSGSRARKLPLGITGTALLVFGLHGIWQWHESTRQPPAAVPLKVVTETVDKPQEVPVKGNEYQVAADMPRQIKIPDRRIQGYVQQVGVDRKQAIAAPSNVHLAGWYTGSAKPGAAGVSILAGHLQGKYADGIFRKLDQVRTDDEVMVEYGDGSWRKFRVIGVDSYAANDASYEQYRQIPGVSSQLTLITCGGKFDKAAESYERRLIVRAALVPS